MVWHTVIDIYHKIHFRHSKALNSYEKNVLFLLISINRDFFIPHFDK